MDSRTPEEVKAAEHDIGLDVGMRKREISVMKDLHSWSI